MTCWCLMSTSLCSKTECMCINKVNVVKLQNIMMLMASTICLWSLFVGVFSAGKVIMFVCSAHILTAVQNINADAFLNKCLQWSLLDLLLLWLLIALSSCLVYVWIDTNLYIWPNSCHLVFIRNQLFIFDFFWTK